MATWVRNLSGTIQATDADLVGNASLTNATAPAGFDPDAVNSVQVQLTVAVVSGTFEAGGGEFHTVYHQWDLVSSGATSLATGNGTDGILDDGTNGGSTSSSDVTDSTVTTGQTVAQWEGATLNPTGGTAQWTDYVKNKGGDGVTVGITSLTVTIDYTPNLGQTIAVNEPSEVESATIVSPVPGAVSIAVNEPTETESAQAVLAVPTFTGAVAFATETETAGTVAPVAGAVSITVGSATETESATATPPIAVISIPVTFATEVESAEIVTPQLGGVQNVSVVNAVETESATAVTFVRSLTRYYPDGDVASNSWDSAPTASQPLYAQIDEVSTDDADYIFEILQAH